MSNITSIGENVKRYNFSDKFAKYTAVKIAVTDETEVIAGDPDVGRTLSLECPWATEQIAKDILDLILGFEYQPYTANGATLDPAVEIGDGVYVQDVYSGIYVMQTRFGKYPYSDISAPSEEEIDHEYPFKTKSDRKITRRLNQTESELKIVSGEISAKVSKVGGDSSSFGWTLDDKSWTIKANNTEVLKVTKSGLTLHGKIITESGKIGAFTISDDRISTNGMTWTGEETVTGIYLGEHGIKLGQNFKVDKQGNITAESGTFRGKVSAGQIEYGGSKGTFSGSGLTGGTVTGSKISENTINTRKFDAGVNTSLGYADFSHDVFNGIGSATLLACTSMIFDKKTIARQSVTVNGQTIQYLGWV